MAFALFISLEVCVCVCVCVFSFILWGQFCLQKLDKVDKISFWGQMEKCASTYIFAKLTKCTCSYDSLQFPKMNTSGRPQMFF